MSPVKANDIKNIDVSEINTSPISLRNLQVDSEAYLGLIDAIRTKGFQSVITVRKMVDTLTGVAGYTIVDGLHRYSAAKACGLQSIPCMVVDAVDSEALDLQLMANLHRVDTKPAEYAAQLSRILDANPLLTEAELAAKLAVSPSWLRDRLSLKLIKNDVILALIDGGQITVTNACKLAKLPLEEMANYVDQAQTMGQLEFAGIIDARTKEIRKATQEGRKAAPAEFQLVPLYQKIAVAKAELADNKVGNDYVKRFNIKTPEEAWAMAIKWVMSVDPISFEAKKAEYDARKRAAAEAMSARAEERKARKAAEAAAAAAEAVAAAAV